MVKINSEILLRGVKCSNQQEDLALPNHLGEQVYEVGDVSLHQFPLYNENTFFYGTGLLNWVQNPNFHYIQQCLQLNNLQTLMGASMDT